MSAARWDLPNDLLSRQPIGPGALLPARCRDAIAAVVWAIYASMLGYLGGETFKENVWLPIVASLGIAMAVGLGVEGWRRFQKRRGKDVLGDQLPQAATD